MPQQTQLAGTRNIIDKNLFDPERGASRTKEAEASAVAMQRIRSMILLGTAVLGNGRYAILQQPSDPRLPAQKAPPGQQAASMRLKVGDMVEGFRLSEIRDRSVVFTNGSSNLEISVDYFRKGDDGLRKGPAPTAPRPPVSPRFPRPNAPGGEDPGLGRE